MPKFMCLDNDEKELGTVKAESEKEALDKSRKLNPNVVAVKPHGGESVVADEEAPKKKKAKAE